MHNSVLIERMLYCMQCIARYMSYPCINPILVQSMNRFFLPFAWHFLRFPFVSIGVFRFALNAHVVVFQPLKIVAFAVANQAVVYKAEYTRFTTAWNYTGKQIRLVSMAVVEYSSLVQGHPHIKWPQIRSTTEQLCLLKIPIKYFLQCSHWHFIYTSAISSYIHCVFVYARVHMYSCSSAFHRCC